MTHMMTEIIVVDDKPQAYCIIKHTLIQFFGVMKLCLYMLC